MSRPRVLLVDDSESILAFEAASLEAHFEVDSARGGEEALAKLANTVPDLVVLDLSMPGINGERILDEVRADPRVAEVPVLIVSSEPDRSQACLARGAQGVLPKPIRSDQLLAAAGRLVDERAQRRHRQLLTCLPMTVGPLEIAVTLDAVDMVASQLATTPLPFGPAYLNQVFELYGEPVFSLDLAIRLGVEHAAPPLERKLVILRAQALRLALCVDDVRHPEEVTPDDFTPSDRVGGAAHGELRETLMGLVRTDRGSLPLIDPRSFVDPRLLDTLAAWLEQRPRLDRRPSQGGPC